MLFLYFLLLIKLKGSITKCYQFCLKSDYHLQHNSSMYVFTCDSMYDSCDHLYVVYVHIINIAQPVVNLVSNKTNNKSMTLYIDV